MNYVLRALRHKNYRLFFIGQSISLVGTWMQQIAVSWLVYRLTGSALMLGLVGFASQIPVLLISPLAGVIVDQTNRHKLLILTQTLALFQSFLFVILIVTNWINVPFIFLLGICLGVINSFDVPARQSFFVHLVETREDLGNAIALNSSVFNVARLLGPSIAGILIALGGEVLCFIVNGLSYIPIILALLSMRISFEFKPSTNKNILRELNEGFRYIFGDHLIRNVLLMLAFVSLVAGHYVVFMPIFARVVLGGGPETLGFLVGATGVGACLGALYIASARNVSGLRKVVSRMYFLFSLGLLAFSFSKVFWFSAVSLCFTGFGMMAHIAGSNTMIQNAAKDEMRGRVMSFFAMALMGTAPIGSLLAGALASKIGAPLTLSLAALVSLAASILFAFNLKKVYPN